MGAHFGDVDAHSHALMPTIARGPLPSPGRHYKELLGPKDCGTSFLSLGNARRELKDAVRGLHAADPRLLDHLMVILDDVQRRHMKRAMAEVVPVVMEGEPTSAEDTRAGPPAKPSRRVGPM